MASPEEGKRLLLVFVYGLAVWLRDFSAIRDTIGGPEFSGQDPDVHLYDSSCPSWQDDARIQETQTLKIVSLGGFISVRFYDIDPILL